MTRSGVYVAVGIVVLLTGCQGPMQEVVQFPITWPGSQPLGEDAPTVSVAPIRLALPSVANEEVAPEGLPTAAVLSVLLIKHLQVNGVNAILESPEAATAQYVLICSVPQLSYGVPEGYPRERRYRAELSCLLRDEEAGTVMWERSLTQGYDQTTVLDLLTNLPPRPHQHDRVLFRECIVPLWDAMASSVGTVLVSRQELSQRD